MSAKQWFSVQAHEEGKFCDMNYFICTALKMQASRKHTHTFQSCVPLTTNTQPFLFRHKIVVINWYIFDFDCINWSKQNTYKFGFCVFVRACVCVIRFKLPGAKFCNAVMWIHCLLRAKRKCMDMRFRLPPLCVCASSESDGHHQAVEHTIAFNFE